MKTITIDFETYQEELQDKEDIGYLLALSFLVKELENEESSRKFLCINSDNFRCPYMIKQLQNRIRAIKYISFSEGKNFKESSNEPN